MLSTIIKKEILENILSFRFPLFLLICVTLIPLGIYVNNLDYAKRVRDYNEQVRLSNEALHKLQVGDIMSGTVSLKGFRPPSLLSIFAQGFENALPLFYDFKFDGYKQGETSIGDESILSVFGKLDFAFIIQMVVSLIVLLFASDMISGEKESGTLRGIFSNRVPRDSLLLGKIAGGYLTMWIVFVIAFLIGLLALIAASFPFFQDDIPARIFYVFLWTSVFLLAYFTIGIMVSTSSDKTRTSLVIILLIWAFFQLIVPKVSDMTASVIHPVRTETEVSLEKSLITNSLNDEQAKELGRQFVATFGANTPPPGRPEQSPEQDKWEKMKKEIQQRYGEQKAERLNQIDQAFQREKKTQQSIASNLSLISPSAAFSRLITDLCQTGEVEKTKYLESVKAHQQVLDANLFSKVKRELMELPNGQMRMTFGIDPVDFKSLPEFSVNHASITEAFKANWTSIVSLIFWLIAPFAVAYVRFLRYDVR